MSHGTCHTLLSSCTRADYVAIYEAIGRRNNYTLTEKYCDKDVFPSPYATSNEVKVIFHSNEVESSVGFKATYSFVPTSELQDSEWFLVQNISCYLCTYIRVSSLLRGLTTSCWYSRVSGFIGLVIRG